jgi:hypothetical protein
MKNSSDRLTIFFDYELADWRIRFPKKAEPHFFEAFGSPLKARSFDL